MSQTIVIGHVALIQRSKKQWFTLDVIKALCDKGYDAVGVFAGECRETEYMTELEQKVKDYDLEKRVVFLGRRGDIPDLLKMLDVLMIPSFEGFPLAGLESAAAGVPVAACNAAGAKEFIDVSHAGEVFLEDNVNEALYTVQNILMNPEPYRVNGMNFAHKVSIIAYEQSIHKQLENVK